MDESKVGTCHCKRCNRHLPQEDFFKDRKYWKQCNICRQNKLASMKIWRETTGKEWLKEYKVEYAAKHRENVRKFKERNPHKPKEYYDKNRETILAKDKIYREKNKEKEKARQYRWKKENPKKHQCPHCEYGSSAPSPVKNHIASQHTEEKHIHCSVEDCEFKCGTESIMKKHITTTHEKKHRCNECAKDFGSVTNLRVHRQAIHDRVKIFKCVECEFKTTTKFNLTNHIKRCTGELHCSSGEYAIMKELDTLGFTYDHNSSYELKDVKMLQWDFIVYTSGDPIFIEYDGKGHFEPIRWGGISQERANAVLTKCQHHDRLKNEFCDNNGYLLLRIPYTQFENTSQIVRDFMSENTYILPE